MSTYTEEQLQQVALVSQAFLRARITGNRVSLQCAAHELNRLGDELGRDVVEAIARELDARAPTGDLSKPIEQET